jgi:UDP-glucuronate 4-epimerase
VSQTILVTGAAGFIGGHVCGALLDAGFEVRGVDNFDPFYDRRIKESAVAELDRRGGFALVEADIRDAGAMAGAVKGCDLVVHLAARAGVRPSIQDPALYASINVEGTVRVLEACRQAGIRRFVFGSSSSVYGDTTPVPFREDAPAVDPVSPYAATKRAGELMCDVCTGLHGLRIAALRFFTVYGPRQRPDLAIHKFTRLLAEGRPIEQFGDGSSERDYTHIDDIVQGVLGAVRWTRSGEPAYEVFNLGESRTVRLDYLVELIGRALGVTPAIELRPPQPGDVRRTCADITKARRLLGYAPKMPIETGIPQFVEWYEGAYGREFRSAP